MKGQCLCGQVRFEISGRLPNFYQCHCSLCRKVTGSTSNTATLVPQEAFRWTAGQETITRYHKPTGYRSDFCSVCGSPVPNPVGDGRRVWIPAGLLDEPAEAAVAVHLHVASQAEWRPASGDVLRYAEAPGLEALELALQRPDP